jgi:hypothetical protein
MGDGLVSFLCTEESCEYHVNVLGVGIALALHLQSSELLTPATGAVTVTSASRGLHTSTISLLACPLPLHS